MTSKNITIEIIDKIKKISIFKELKDNPNALKIIANYLDIQKFPANTEVITEKDTGEELYILKSGKVEIQKLTRNKEKYTVTTLSDKDNTFFGEMALLNPDQRSATVITLTNSEFYVLSKQNFIELGNLHPKIGLAVTREISKILCERLRKVNADVITLFDALVGEVIESGGIEE